MIFYFSGTGNSLFVAKTIAEAQGETLFSIPEQLTEKEGPLAYKLKDGDLLGFVFPVHAWGPRRSCWTSSAAGAEGGKPYVFSLCTCGDEEGKATHILQKSLARKGLSLDSAFCLVMPNNYIVMFDPDREEVARQKLEQASSRLSGINGILQNRRSGVMELLPGRMPALKSLVVNPLFIRFARGTNPFYATDACTGCGFCEKVCPIHTISVRGKPVWGENCLQCMACINRCPTQAIQYGKRTENRVGIICPDSAGQEESRSPEPFRFRASDFIGCRFS
jgi:NAD-dependent dihydropyrimidine dehydrogenase PreA subunit/flavodoxin